jgi:hypothetical protein
MSIARPMSESVGVFLENGVQTNAISVINPQA